MTDELMPKYIKILTPQWTRKNPKVSE